MTSSTDVGPGWHKLDVHLIVGGADASLIEVWLDGVLAVTRTDTLGTGALAVVEIGDRTGGRASDVAFDDVQVAAP